MSVFVSLLRGINVGGNHMIKMDLLRELYASLGFRDVQTLLQSGNVVFRAGARNPAALSKRIEDAVETACGFRPSVVLRNTSELRQAIANNPFAGREGIDPSRLAVTFLGAEPSAEARDKVLAIDAAPEELRIVGRELYIYFPNGMARPKLSIPLVERTLKVPCTGRNWNTATKLLTIAEALEAKS
jgi:uncharacterized protein (DUF1697 family)